jgi:hypothetical protein
MDQEATVLIRLIRNVQRRAAPRYTLAATARATVSAGGWSESARGVNLSAGGVGLLLQRGIATGTAVRVQLDGAPQEAPEFLARVAHSTRQGPGEWFIGCQFTRPLGEAELREVLRALGVEVEPAGRP